MPHPHLAGIGRLGRPKSSNLAERSVGGEGPDEKTARPGIGTGGGWSARTARSIEGLERQFVIEEAFLDLVETGLTEVLHAEQLRLGPGRQFAE